MIQMVKKIGIIFSGLGLLICTFSSYAQIEIVAAENVYGAVAQEIGGDYVHVTSLIDNPNQNPHLFTLSPKKTLAITKAQLIIYNGANYDPWMKEFLGIQMHRRVRTIVVADLMNMGNAQNPHLWYKPETMPVFVDQLVKTLSQMDPEHKDYYHFKRDQFHRRYIVILDTVTDLKKRYKGYPISATEPVFNYMAEAIGLQVSDVGFQMHVMKNVPPTPKEIKAFEKNLEQHMVYALIYNNQVVDPLTQRMLSTANKQKIPVVGVSEIMPKHHHYIPWLEEELLALDKALRRQ